MPNRSSGSLSKSKGELPFISKLFLVQAVEHVHDLFHTISKSQIWDKMQTCGIILQGLKHPLVRLPETSKIFCAQVKIMVTCPSDRCIFSNFVYHSVLWTSKCEAGQQFFTGNLPAGQV